MRGLMVVAVLAPIGLLLAVSGTAVGFWLGLIVLCVGVILCWALVVVGRERREIRNGTYA